MNEESRIEQQLAREPRPELSPFFAVRVTNELRQIERRRPRVPLLLRIYWLALLVAAVVMLHNVAVRFELTIVSLILVPVGFALWIYRDVVTAIVLRWSSAMFGSSS